METTTFGAWSVPSQDISVMSNAEFEDAKKKYLPNLINLWIQIEWATGYRWRATSFVRDSPSHKTGRALDIAPDIDPADLSKYSVSNDSDPVLYKREKLLRKLQAVCKVHRDQTYDLGIFVEPDHLHLMLFTPQVKDDTTTQLFKWGVLKECYPDTYSRSKLPLIK